MRRTCAVLLAAMLCIGLLPSNVGAGNGKYFPETGQTSSNAFYEFWQTHGAVPGLGLPLSPVYKRKDHRIIQMYERGEMEWHPENTRANRVQIARLGDLLLDRLENAKNQATGDTTRYAAERGCADTSNCETFPATNHTVLGAFRDFWYENGGLATFGLPLTEEFSFCTTNDGECAVHFSAQFFERNIFEWHPEINGGVVLASRQAALLWDTLNKTNLTRATTLVPDYDGDGAFMSPLPSTSRYDIYPSPEDTPAPSPPTEAVRLRES